MRGIKAFRLRDSTSSVSSSEGAFTHAHAGFAPMNVVPCANNGRYTEEKTEGYVILNMADMLVDSKGNEVFVSKRLDDIKDRYGEYSDQYLTACDVCFRIGLTAENTAGKIT